MLCVTRANSIRSAAYWGCRSSCSKAHFPQPQTTYRQRPVITLYDHPRSGNCYKVRLFLALIGQTYRSEFVDVLARKNRTAEFERISPFCQVPALIDDGEALWDSQAILLHLSRKYAPCWLAATHYLGAMYAWLSVASNEIANSLQPLRLAHIISKAEAAHHLGVREEMLDVEGARERSQRLLSVMNTRLKTHEWLAGDATPSVADLACYGYASLAAQAALSLSDYPSVLAWATRIEQLPGYVRIDQHAASL